MSTDHQELQLRRFLDSLRGQHRMSRDVGSVLRATLRAAAGFFDADAVCIAQLAMSGSEAEIDFQAPADTPWDLDLLAGFLLNERPPVQDAVALAPVERRQRKRWRALALQRERAFDSAERSALTQITRQLSLQIARMDQQRTADVRARIDGKIMAELRPKDLFYQILHGLRSLTRYDHSTGQVRLISVWPEENSGR